MGGYDSDKATKGTVTEMYAMPAKSGSSLSQTSVQSNCRTGVVGVRVKARYALMGLHLAFILTSLIQSYVQGNNALSLLVHAIGLAAWLIYVPTAIILCYRRKACSFDHAAGEVSYTTVQAVIWILSAAVSFLAIVQSSCTELLPAPSSSPQSSRYLADPASSASATPQTQLRCSKYLVTAILSLVHVAVLLVWTAWIVLEVRRNYKGKMGKGFKVSIGELLRGSRPV